MQGMTESGLAVITGATGFVGGHLARHLLSRGCRVRLLVRDPSMAEELRLAGAEIRQGDIRHPESLGGLAEGADKFFHVAALFRQAGFPDKVYHEVNFEGTRNCLEEARRAGVKRFVHCSTVGVLSNIEHPPADETDPYNPGDIYQESKAEGEKLALDYFRRGLVPGVVVRPAMIYGPGDLRMLKLYKGVARRRFVMLGSGLTLAHYVYIDDLVNGFWLASEKPGVEGEVFIIAGSKEITLNELVALIAKAAGVRAPRLKLPVSPFQWLGSLCEAVMVPLHLEPPIYRRRVDFFTKNRSFSIAKARRMLGYEPAVDMEEGVTRTLRWYVSKNLI
jgi:dihydroflavonol-4-reductase